MGLRIISLGLWKEGNLHTLFFHHFFCHEWTDNLYNQMIDHVSKIVTLDKIVGPSQRRDNDVQHLEL